MKTFFGTYKTKWKNVEVITRLLRSGGFHPDVEPPPQPNDVNVVVEIPIKVKAQGKDHVSIARSIILGNPKELRAEEITGFSELPSSPWSIFKEFISERGWETLALLFGGFASVYGAFYTLAYHFKDANMTLEWYHHIELSLLSIIPAAVDLCYAGAWRKKNAFSIDEKNHESKNISQSNLSISNSRNTNMLGTPND